MVNTYNVNRMFHQMHEIYVSFDVLETMIIHVLIIVQNKSCLRLHIFILSDQPTFVL